ncbi:hypothetical protein SAMD00079811_53060 [Scytonema sp. HK-05]|uniref:hypothetical protein n=1 Tax=Scytonema sp. HK-05 TaxID=1137095 RepID=UPI000B24C1BF|nr:hypothetical protein [Scytonema sp. HK-05]BAY47687.1 hypothetical protein SAMD00079811_53060 [Scytonema sp. HK-05]
MYNNQVMAATHDNVKIATKTITSYLNHIGSIQSTCTVSVAAIRVPIIHPEVSPLYAARCCLSSAANVSSVSVSS